MHKLLVFLLGIISIAAVACSGGSGGDESAVSEESPSATVEAVVSSEIATESAAATTAGELADQIPVGGIFRRLWSDPPTLDPHLTGDTTSAFLVVEIFSGLVALNSDLELIPDIAERWEISDDGLVYTFHLRPEAKFHDGKPVTAYDFKWSIERAAHPDTASAVADTYLNDIVGADDVFEGRATEMRGITVIDDHTLQLTIDAPKAYFLAKLTYPTAYVVDRENLESGGRSWFDTPNGTGPFRLREYRIGERIVLERNDLFYREPAKLDTILLNLAGGQSMAMYENDEIDITGVGLFDLDRVLDPNEELNEQLVIAPPDFMIVYIGFNTNKPPFDSLEFRQALSHAVDKELIANEVLSGLNLPAYGILPPGFPGYNPNLEGLRYDPDLARALLAASPYGDPDSRPRIEITVPGTGGTIGLDLEVVIEMWRTNLGVDVEIQQSEWATYLGDLNSHELQAFAGLGWAADYPDPQDFLDIKFHSESSINDGNYQNSELDAVLEEARTEQDVTRRIALYHEAEEIIVNEAAWFPLWYPSERHVLIKSHVRGYKLTPMIVPKMSEIYIVD